MSVAHTRLRIYIYVTQEAGLVYETVVKGRVRRLLGIQYSI